MSDEQIYGFMPFNHADRPVEAMVGETVYDYNGKVLGWIVSKQSIAAWNTRADDAPEQPVNKARDTINALRAREHMDNGVSVQMCPNDTRERLEADIRRWATDERYEDYYNDEDIARFVIRLLDRQAAITTKAMQDYVNRKLSVRGWKAHMDKLQAERDELQAAIDAMNNGQFYSMYKAKCEECEQLKKVVRTQAESFKKLECELGKQ